MQKEFMEPLNYDARVKRIMKIETALGYAVKLSLMLVGFLIMGTLFGLNLSNIKIAKALSNEEIGNLFMVPIVRSTGNGAEVYQIQTGAGFSGNYYNNSAANFNGNQAGTQTNNLNAQKKTLINDPFRTGSAYSPLEISQEKTVIESAGVYIKANNNIPTLSDNFSGTTNTVFNFSGMIDNSDGVIRAGAGSGTGRYEYRWDFENDGKYDSYFSRIGSINHIYKHAGNYRVKLEVLDGNGKIHIAFANVKVVDNEPPKAVFSANKVMAPQNSIIRFDSGLSSDSQTGKNSLKFRFDWNNDGVWDTAWQNKTSWNKKFTQVGKHTVVMEVQDPEGLNAFAKMEIEIFNDYPPTAILNVTRLSDDKYQLDASNSFDDFGKLRFRWDIDYNGKNDLIFTTNWSTTPKYLINNMQALQSDRIRLQVMDEQGQIAESIFKF